MDFKIEHCYQKIPGYMTQPMRKIYRDAVNHFPFASRFVEVGSYLGQSAAFMMVEIMNSGKQIKFSCIDTWEGNPEVKKKCPASKIYIKKHFKGDIYSQFKENLERYDLFKFLRAIQKTSVQASKGFGDNSIDFIFIDAEHTYEAVKEDIKHWLPKVKKDGWLCGHDYSRSFPGVKKAVDELLPERKIIKHCWKWIKR